MALPRTTPESGEYGRPGDEGYYKPRPPREISEEEYQKMLTESWMKSPEGKRMQEEASKASGQSQEMKERLRLEEEIRRISEESEKRTRELENQLWSQAKGEETVAQRQFAEQLAQGQRLQTGMTRSVRGLSGERARRYSDEFGSKLLTEGRPRLASLRATEMQEAEEALTRFQSQRDALALQYLSMQYSAEDARRMADIEYQNMLNTWREQMMREAAARSAERRGFVSSWASNLGRVITLGAGAGR